MATVLRYPTWIDGLAAAPPARCIECGGKVGPTEVVCVGCADPRMHRPTRDRAGGYEAIAHAERLG